MLMRKSRVLLEESLNEQALDLKLCINRQIIKHSEIFKWNQPCKRWETCLEPRFPRVKHSPLELELFFSENGCAKVLGEAVVPASMLGHLDQEVKVVLKSLFSCLVMMVL